MIYNGHGDHLDDVGKYVRLAHQELKPFRGEFKFLVATGMSGVLVASPLALRLHRPLVVIRKPNDNSHQHRPVLNPGDALGPYVVIDDFISSGGTYQRIRDVMETECYSASYAGVFLYSDGLLSWAGDGLIDYKPAVPGGATAVVSRGGLHIYQPRYKPESARCLDAPSNAGMSMPCIKCSRLVCGMGQLYCTDCLYPEVPSWRLSLGM